MNVEMKALLNYVPRNDMIIGFLLSIIICAFLGVKVAFIFLLGIIVAIINFIFSGVILDKSLKANKVSLLYSFIAILRILIIVVSAIPFSHNIIFLLAYLGGFIIHFPILIFSFIRKQKGSD